MSFDIMIIMGSDTDKKKVEESEMLQILQEVGVSYTASVLSAHRHNDDLKVVVEEEVTEGTKVFIGIAGMSAHLPGAIAALTDGLIPIIGVPLSSDCFDGMDALLSIVRMPSGRPVGVQNLNKAGLENAAIHACQILATSDSRIYEGLVKYQAKKAIEKKTDIDFLTFRPKEGE